MRFDWFAQNVRGRRTLYVSRDSNPAFTSTLGRQVDVDGSPLPRWAVVREPVGIELRPDIDLASSATQLFAQLGPIGCFHGEVIKDSVDFSHPAAGLMRVRQTKFGILKSASGDAQAIADSIGWRLTDKERWWVFENLSSSAVQDAWLAAAVALASIHDQPTSLDAAVGWQDALHLKLDVLRGARRTVDVSRALLGTIDTLLEFGAIQLAEERLAAFRQSGGAEPVALPYAVEIAWAKQDWNAVIRSGAEIGRTTTPASAWRIAWAEHELGRAGEASQRLDRFSELPPASSSTGRWFRATRAAIEAARHRLEYSIRLLADFPRTDALASARDRAAARVVDAVRTLELEGRQKVLDALGAVTSWKRDELPEELETILSGYLVAKPTPAPSHDDAYEAWSNAIHGRTDNASIRREAERLLGAELDTTRSPARISRLLRTVVAADAAWRPSPGLVTMLRRLEPGSLPLSPEAQASLARAFLVAADHAEARRWADEASYALMDLDALDCQSIAEALAPQFDPLPERAQEAWIRTLRHSPPWKTLPRLGRVGDLTRDAVVSSLAEHLFVTSQYSQLIELLLRELEPASNWSALWSARGLVLILLDGLCEIGDKDRAFDVAAQLWPVALAAGESEFLLKELTTRFDDARRLGPLDPSGWQVVLEGMAPYVKVPAFEPLREWAFARASTLLARAQWLTPDRDFDARSLFDVLQSQGLALPIELRPQEVANTPAIAPSQRLPKSVLIVGGYSDVQRRAVEELEGQGIVAKTLNPGFDENVDEKKVREALGEVERVVVVWRCILHRVSITLDQLLSRPDFARVERVFARGKGHSSIVSAAVGGR